MKQSLVTEKNRKIRRVREVYPEINIKLLYRRDFHRILAKYGFGPLAKAGARGIDRVLLTTRQIHQRVAQLGKQISEDYKNREPILVGVQRGMVCFMADLMREITLPIGLDFMSISHYAGAASGVRITKDLDIAIPGRDVVLVEDIVDTGMTLKYLMDHWRPRVRPRWWCAPCWTRVSGGSWRCPSATSASRCPTSFWSGTAWTSRRGTATYPLLVS